MQLVYELAVNSAFGGYKLPSCTIIQFIDTISFYDCENVKLCTDVNL